MWGTVQRACIVHTEFSRQCVFGTLYLKAVSPYSIISQLLEQAQHRSSLIALGMAFGCGTLAVQAGRQSLQTQRGRPHLLKIFSSFRRHQSINNLKSRLAAAKAPTDGHLEYRDPIAEGNNDLMVKPDITNGYETFFRSSQLRSLTSSEYTSFIPGDTNGHSTDQQHHHNKVIGYDMNDEMYVDLDMWSDTTKKTTEVGNKSAQHLIDSHLLDKKASLSNPTESIQSVLVRRNYTKKNKSMSYEDFYGKVLDTQDKIIDFEFQLPPFPSEITEEKILRYLHAVNSIDMRYDIHNHSRRIYLQVINLLQNLHKLEGILDIHILHELIKFLGQYSMHNKIIDTINKFEAIGVLPNRNTLHLILYQLMVLPNYKAREKLLNFYLKLVILRWNVTTDLVTKALIYDIKKPSRKRLALGKQLINEGFAYEDIKWSICADYIVIELDKTAGMMDFSKFKRFLVKNGNLNDTYYDEIVLFDLYINELVERGLYQIAINEIGKKSRLNLTECWMAIIDRLIERNEYWLSLAVFNLMKRDARRDEIELRRVAASFINHQLKFYGFFMRQPPLHISKRNEEIFFNVMRVIQRDSDVEFERFKQLLRNRRDDLHVNDEIDSEIAEQFNQICVLSDSCSHLNGMPLRPLQIDTSVFPWGL
jgi:hypothetical protein